MEVLLDSQTGKFWIEPEEEDGLEEDDLDTRRAFQIVNAAMRGNWPVAVSAPIPPGRHYDHRIQIDLVETAIVSTMNREATQLSLRALTEQLLRLIKGISSPPRPPPPQPPDDAPEIEIAFVEGDLDG